QPRRERAYEGPQEHVGELLVSEHDLIELLALQLIKLAGAVGDGVGRPGAVFDQRHLAEVLAALENGERLFADAGHHLRDANLALRDDEHRGAGITLAEDVGAALEVDLLERAGKL